MVVVFIAVAVQSAFEKSLYNYLEVHAAEFLSHASILRKENKKTSYLVALTTVTGNKIQSCD